MIRKYLKRLVPEVHDENVKPCFRMYRKRIDDGSVLVLTVPSPFSRVTGIYNDVRLKYYPSALVRDVWLLKCNLNNDSWKPSFSISKIPTIIETCHSSGVKF